MTPAEQAIRAALAAGPTPGPWMLETVQTSCGVCHKIGPFPGKQGGSPSRHACMYADYPSVGNPADAELLANARLMAACNPTNLRALLDELDRLRERVASADAFQRDLNAALNTGDGMYRP